MKKSFRYIIYVSLPFIIAAGSFSYGFYSSQLKIYPYYKIKGMYFYLGNKKDRLFYMLGLEKQGQWKRYTPSRDVLSLDRKENLDKILALPYLQGYVSAPDEVNITFYDENRAFNGLNFCVSGHKPVAYIMDMKGNILHEWSLKIENVWPEGFDKNFNIYKFEKHKTFWRRAHMFDNGDILAIFEGIGILKIDKRSDLIWANKCRAHHDFFVHENGNIYSLTHKDTQPEYGNLRFEGPILEDFITILSPDGKILKSVSILKCFVNSDYAPLLDGIDNDGDIFHTNTIEVLDGKVSETAPMFEKGLVLVSIKMINLIALVDIEEEKVTWALSGMWRYQHQPTILENGNILLFDNLGENYYSKAIEFNPLSLQIVWAYRGGPDNNFLSVASGSVQRLPNGNTLITETDAGRAFEVTQENEIVWEYLNTHRAGEKDELIATLLEVIRIAPDRNWVSEL